MCVCASVYVREIERERQTARQRHAHPLIPTWRSDMVVVTWGDYLNEERKEKN